MAMRKDAYPANWEEISRRIRYERAGGKCEWCGAPNDTYIRRNRVNPALWELASPEDEPDAQWYRPIKVMLTVHHIGVDKPDGTPGDRHDKLDVRDENLAALCQRCHLFADLDIHIENARQTRRAKREQSAQESGQMRLF
ncbi:MAG: hypothetical protein HZC41_24975 [Chloroflexi bacterium]|nr:hypothetical protein [Chloroflexota bacterium]